MATIVLKLGDDISTDVIYPGRYMATVLPSETPQFAFADMTQFNAKLKAKEIPAGSIVAAGKNFGCGSSREQAASALCGHGLTIIAEDFARIFLQNSINLGLNLVICPGFVASEGEEIELAKETVVNKSSGVSFPIVQLPRARQAIIDAGGLIPYTRRRLLASTHRAP